MMREKNPESNDDDEILYQGPGYTIAKSSKAGTLVPYSSVKRPDDTNHGWIDTRNRPDLVSLIPEASGRSGLTDILTVVAQPGSPIMSSGCECGLFEHSLDTKLKWHAGGFVMLMYDDGDRNSDWKQLEELATWILSGINPTQNHITGYEIIIEPLRHFFGRTDCYALMFKPMGYGDTEEAAWLAFDFAASAAAKSLARMPSISS
ncbi:MAG: hypothetical protein IT473_02290 [Lysobacter sp.]|nr:hypothetical protein [Lysobacter sp.]